MRRTPLFCQCSTFSEAAVSPERAVNFSLAVVYFLSVFTQTAAQRRACGCAGAHFDKPPCTRGASKTERSNGERGGGRGGRDRNPSAAVGRARTGQRGLASLPGAWPSFPSLGLAACQQHRLAKKRLFSLKGSNGNGQNGHTAEYYCSGSINGQASMRRWRRSPISAAVDRRRALWWMRGARVHAGAWVC